MKDMKAINEHARKTLGVEFPACYAHFLQHHGNRLAADPLTEKSWIPGLGNLYFVIGTTQSFRSAFPSLPHEYVVIGYAGRKLIPKINEEIDVYVMLNTKNTSVAEIDSLGKWHSVADHFFDWFAVRLAEALLHLNHPTQLFVVAFEEKHKAEDLHRSLIKMEKEGIIELDEIATVSRDPNGHIHVHHEHVPSAAGATAGGISGLLIGTLFLHPLLDAAIGAVTGAVSSKASETLKYAGVDEQFVKELCCLLKPGMWAVFILVKSAAQRSVLTRIRGVGGTLLTASVSGRQKAALQAILDGKAEDPVSF